MLNNQSKVAFLVSSALETPNGNEESFKIRLADTLSTINSINAHFNNAKIFIVESSWREPATNISEYFPGNVEVFDFWSDPYILTIQQRAIQYGRAVAAQFKPTDGSDPYEEFRLRYVKNATESYALNQFMLNNDLSEYERIFKISGRYSLQPTWDLKTHDVPKFVTSTPILSNQSGIDIDYLRLCYMWSAPGQDYDKLKRFMSSVKSEVYHKLFKNELIDMEHAFYKHIPLDWAHELTAFKIFTKVSGRIIMIR